MRTHHYVNTAETALFSPTLTDPHTGWRAYFDEASAVNFYLVNDLMGNVDGGEFYSSDYVAKNKGNPFLYMGPVWDFDISSGNVNYKSIGKSDSSLDADASNLVCAAVQGSRLQSRCHYTIQRPQE